MAATIQIINSLDSYILAEIVLAYETLCRPGMATDVKEDHVKISLINIKLLRLGYAAHHQY